MTRTTEAYPGTHVAPSPPPGLADLEPDERLAACRAALEAGATDGWVIDQFVALLRGGQPSPIRRAIERAENRVKNARAARALKSVERLLGASPEAVAAEAAVCVVRRFGAWPAADRSRLRAAMGRRFAAALTALVDSEHEEDRRAVFAVASDGDLYAVVHLLPDLLADPSVGIAREAERQLAHAARDLAPEDAARRRIVSDAVVRAARSFTEHKSHGVFLAALLLGDRPGATSPLGRLLEEREGPAVQGVRGVLRYTKMPIARRRAFEWIATEHLAKAALDRLLRTEGPGDHDAVLSRAALCLEPGRSLALAGISISPRVEKAAIGVLPDDPPRRVEHVVVPKNGPIPDADTFAGMTPGARRGLPRFVAALDLPRPLARAALEPMLTDPDPSVRLSAAVAADRADLADHIFDTDPAVARSAFLRWSDARRASRPIGSPAATERARLLAHLERSPVTEVRTLATTERSRIDPLGSPVAALALFAEDPRSLRRLIADRLESGDRAPRLDAIRVLRRLRLAGDFTDQLAALTEGSDPVIAATAVAALAGIGSEAATDAIEAALGADEPRVRANAVESAARPGRLIPGRSRSGSSCLDRIAELKLDPHHRVRANATAAELRSNQCGESDSGRLFSASAVSSLAAMLADERADHRLAGAWLAERVLLGPGRNALGIAWPDLAARVERLAFDDPDERVRARGSRCVDRLRVTQRAEWSRRLNPEPATGAA